MLTALSVSNEDELNQIIRLQSKFLRGKTSSKEERSQGFLTVTHTKELLQQLHRIEPSIIAKDAEVLAGYALVMAKVCAELIPELLPMFEVFNQLLYKQMPINDYNFYVMGQICVDKPYRGKGVFDLLYRTHKERFSDNYDFVITEVSTRNFRSLRAHERIGFKPFHVYTDHIDEWSIMIWDWTIPQKS